MPADFTRVNPNTGTAPVFRTRRDADITRRIYERHPVLVDRSQGVRAARLAGPLPHDVPHGQRLSSLPHCRSSWTRMGFYPVQGNRWKKGEELYLSLYEGKMVQTFDHRAASAVVNPSNLKRPSQTRETTGTEHADPVWLPNPRFWVPSREVERSMPSTHGCDDSLQKSLD